MTVAIMTDNQSGIFPEEGKKLGVYILRMPFFLDGKQIGRASCRERV